MVRQMMDFERRVEQVGDEAIGSAHPKSPARALSAQERSILKRIEGAGWFCADGVDERFHCVEMWATGLLKFAAREDRVGYSISAKGLAAVR